MTLLSVRHQDHRLVVAFRHGNVGIVGGVIHGGQCAFIHGAERRQGVAVGSTGASESASDGAPFLLVKRELVERVLRECHVQRARVWMKEHIRGLQLVCQALVCSGRGHVCAPTQSANRRGRISVVVFPKEPMPRD